METDRQNLQLGQGSQVAAHACTSCRKQKRKCDKLLPSCGLCVRIGRPCDYSVQDQPAAPTGEDFANLQRKVADLEGLLSRASGSGNSSTSVGTLYGNGSNASNGSNSNGGSPGSLLPILSTPQNVGAGPSAFPTLFFLDSEAFEYERFQIQAPYVRLPPGALQVLGDSTQLRSMIEEYFVTTHTYFPIISKIRLYQHLANPLHEPGADIALLFLAMKLITSEIPDGVPAQTQLYSDVKSFFTYVETQNGFSVQMMQALLLIALYEMGHAIYPACYLTIGHAARLGHAMGIHERGAPQMLPRCTTWTEQEERRRMWWAVIILDRFVNIGHRSKPFATSDPSLDTHLPTDDNAWDRGQMHVAAPIALSASQTIRAAPFARTCQAGHLLGKIIRHINDKHLPLDYKFNEALQLHRTMRALAGMLPAEAEEDDPAQRPTLCSSMAICYSALLTLYDQYSCSKGKRHIENAPETQLVMQKESIDGLGEISALVVTLARRVRAFIERAGLGRLSPFVIDSLYQSAANYAWYVRESSDQDCQARLTELKEVLNMCERRWKVAGAYLSSLYDFWDKVDDYVRLDPAQF